MQKIDGRYLRELREEHGYSLRAFSEKIYASKSTVQRWEKSYLPEQDEILNKIADVFCVTVDEMRSQSELKYGNKSATDNNDAEPELTPEQLAELKFSAKRLIVPIVLLFAIGFILTMFTLLV